MTCVQSELCVFIFQRDLYGTKAEMVMAEVAAASGASGQSLQQLSSRGSKFNLTGGSGTSGGSGPGMKTKWMKAFRTLTNSSSSQNVASSPASTTSAPAPSSGLLVTSNNVSGSDTSIGTLSSTMKNSREYEKYVFLNCCCCCPLVTAIKPMKSRQSLSNLFVLFCWLFFLICISFLFFCRLLLLLCDA